MSGNFIYIEGPADLSEETDFDKFMDEILETETKKKSIKEEEEGKDESLNRKIVRKHAERPANSIRFGRK